MSDLECVRACVRACACVRVCVCVCVGGGGSAILFLRCVIFLWGNDDFRLCCSVQVLTAPLGALIT